MLKKNLSWSQRGLHTIKRTFCHILEIIAFAISLLFQPRRSTIPPIKDRILLTPALELSKQIKSGKLTSEQVVKTFIGQIKRVNPIINALVDARFELAIEEARALDKRLEEARNGAEDKSLLEHPLIGVPFTIKETISVEGSAYSAGLPSRKLKRATRSNKAIEQLIKSGLIPIGSTNTPCMNIWWDSSNMVYGQTNNPYDLSRISGGSSGGEAALMAAAGSLLGVGSDLAGSIRIPCNFCGVFGHKATTFIISTNRIYPVMGRHEEKLRGVGPITRYACDLAPMLKLMVNQSELIKLRLDEPVDLKQIKFYYLEDIGDPLASKCNTDIIAGLRAAIEHFGSIHKAKTQRIELEELRYGFFLWCAERSTPEGPLTEADHEDGIQSFNPIVELFKKSVNASDYPLNTIVVSLLINKFSLKHGSKEHLRLTKKAAQLRKRFNDILGDDGVLLMPTHPQPAPHHQTTIPKLCNISYTAVANILQAPITQCPLGMSKEGLPFGVQVISKAYNDRLTLAVAQELERAFGGWLPPSRVSA